LNLASDQADGIRLKKRYGAVQDSLFLFLEDALIALEWVETLH
jgi:hypothetical protein